MAPEEHDLNPRNDPDVQKGIDEYKKRCHICGATGNTVECSVCGQWTCQRHMNPNKLNTTRVACVDHV
jgi:hypothetical protein